MTYSDIYGWQTCCLFTENIFKKNSSSPTWKPFVWPWIFQTCLLREDWNKSTVFTQGLTARPRCALLLVKRFISFLLDIAGAVSVRLDRSAAGRPPTRAAAGDCCHANRCLFSPSDMWKVTKRPLESNPLRSCHFGAFGDRPTLRVYFPAPELLLYDEMAWEIRPGFLWPWVGVIVWSS